MGSMIAGMSVGGFIGLWSNLFEVLLSWWVALKDGVFTISIVRARNSLSRRFWRRI